MTGRFLLYALFGFFSGSVLYGYVLPKLFLHVDVTELADDGNPGGANAFTFGGKPLGLACILLDILKGAFPVYLAARALPMDTAAFALILAAPVAGHAFSPFRRGHGGKAISVSFGVLLAIYPESGLLLILAGAMLVFSLVLVVRPHRCRTILAFCCAAVWALIHPMLLGVRLGMLLIAAMVIFRHRSPAENESRQLLLLGKVPLFHNRPRH